MDRSEFLWMFPCYILANNYIRTPGGNPVFDENIRFATPTIAPGRSPAIAIFTDSDAANEFVQCTYPNQQIDLLELPDTTSLKRFLDVAVHDYRYLAVDLNAKNRSLRMMLIDDVLAHLEHL